MNDDSPDVASTEEQFSQQLDSLLGRAHRSGVDVEGHWTCRSGDRSPDWDVEVVRVESGVPGGE